MTDPRDTYAPRLTGRDKLPDLAPQSGPWKYPPRRRDTTARRDAWIFAAGVALVIIALGFAVFHKDPIGRAAEDAVKAEHMTFPKGY